MPLVYLDLGIMSIPKFLNSCLPIPGKKLILRELEIVESFLNKMGFGKYFGLSLIESE